MEKTSKRKFVVPELLSVSATSLHAACNGSGSGDVDICHADGISANAPCFESGNSPTGTCASNGNSAG